MKNAFTMLLTYTIKFLEKENLTLNSRVLDAIELPFSIHNFSCFA